MLGTILTTLTVNLSANTVESRIKHFASIGLRNVESVATDLFQHRQTTHFSPAFKAIWDTTFGFSRSINLLILSPETAAAASSDMATALDLNSLGLVVLKATATPVDMAKINIVTVRCNIEGEIGNCWGRSDVLI